MEILCITSNSKEWCTGTRVLGTLWGMAAVSQIHTLACHAVMQRRLADLLLLLLQQAKTDRCHGLEATLTQLPSQALLSSHNRRLKQSHLSVACHWEVLPQWMSSEAVVCEYAAQVRMSAEEHSKHVPSLALKPVSCGVHRDNAGNSCHFITTHLQEENSSRERSSATEKHHLTRTTGSGGVFDCGRG